MEDSSAKDRSNDDPGTFYEAHRGAAADCHANTFGCFE